MKMVYTAVAFTVMTFVHVIASKNCQNEVYPKIPCEGQKIRTMTQVSQEMKNNIRGTITAAQIQNTHIDDIIISCGDCITDDSMRLSDNMYTAVGMLLETLNSTDATTTKVWKVLDNIKPQNLLRETQKERRVISKLVDSSETVKTWFERELPAEMRYDLTPVAEELNMAMKRVNATIRFYNEQRLDLVLQFPRHNQPYIVYYYINLHILKTQNKYQLQATYLFCKFEDFALSALVRKGMQYYGKIPPSSNDSLYPEVMTKTAATPMLKTVIQDIKRSLNAMAIDINGTITGYTNDFAVSCGECGDCKLDNSTYISDAMYRSVAMVLDAAKEYNTSSGRQPMEMGRPLKKLRGEKVLSVYKKGEYIEQFKVKKNSTRVSVNRDLIEWMKKVFPKQVYDDILPIHTQLSNLLYIASLGQRFSFHQRWAVRLFDLNSNFQLPGPAQPEIKFSRANIQVELRLYGDASISLAGRYMVQNYAVKLSQATERGLMYYGKSQ